ncbi:hypothetical protein PoB_004175900 [Plakobranchus ocellatus]|uniref:Uncharacterized protein n=1 Tax=Plakobranchus ocellatus TaxID=259542 RepID=A0AAV4BA57_9GAST|nr:hypothetical protein PoB_004175900 [Plakobranchus ocellatus]
MNPCVFPGFTETDFDYLFDDAGNDTNTTTVAPETNDTTVAPTSESPSGPPGEDTTTADITSTHVPSTPVTVVPPKKKGHSGPSFDGASFAGGIILGLGLVVIVFVGYTLYKRTHFTNGFTEDINLCYLSFSAKAQPQTLDMLIRGQSTKLRPPHHLTNPPPTR